MPEIAKILFVILPVVLAGVAHSVAIRADLFPWAARRLDFGLRLFGEPLFGEKKTWRGLLIMSGMTSVCAWLLSFVLGPEQLPQGFAQLAQPESAATFGLLIGFGYSLGELPNSFVKRRLKLPPGVRPGGPGKVIFYLIDQADSVAGIVLLVWAVGSWVPTSFMPNSGPPVDILFALFMVGSLVHIVFDMLLYLFEVKKLRWHAWDVSPAVISASQSVAYWACRLGMRLYPRYRVHRDPNFEIAQEGTKYIIAANHVRALDPFLASVAIPWGDFKKLLPVRYMTHDAFIERTWQKLLMFPLGCFSARKEGDKGGLELALDFLEKGHTVFIFPEGRRIKGSSGSQYGVPIPHRFAPIIQARVGVAYLAAGSGAKIIPVNIRWLDAEERSSEGVGVVLHVGSELAVPSLRSSNASPLQNDLQPVADGVLHHIYSLGRTTDGGRPVPGILHQIQPDNVADGALRVSTRQGRNS